MMPPARYAATPFDQFHFATLITPTAVMPPFLYAALAGCCRHFRAAVFLRYSWLRFAFSRFHYAGFFR
jgi:prepilin signal peptidase PulO-like enzyme (type II secretory pathway)